MAIPSPVKFTKNGVTYIGQVDRVKYTLTELIRGALRDTGRYVCRMTRKKIKKRTGRLARNTQYWVRKKETDLQVGFKPGGFYGMYQELGTDKQVKLAALSTTVKEEIAEIVKIQSQYLSALGDEAKALSMICESEYQGGETGE
jgi:hypothetical protein